MKSDPKTSPGTPPAPLRLTRTRSRRFRYTTFETQEAKLARKLRSPVPYFRLHDNLCRVFLEQAADPREFAGLKLMFPFVRELSLRREPCGPDQCQGWMFFAFMAGFDLSKAHPEFLEDVLPGETLQASERWLRMIRARSGEETLSPRGLEIALSRIGAEKRARLSPDQHVPALVEALTASFRAGFAAGTVARTDPVLAEFVWDIPSWADPDLEALCWALEHAPVLAVGKSIPALLEHPLLRLAREHFRHNTLEQRTMLEGLRRRLRLSGVQSESDCPCSEQDLVGWIAAGLDYGSEVLAHWPRRVRRITNQDLRKLRTRCLEVRLLVQQAGGADPGCLLDAMKAWLERARGFTEPRSSYGTQLAQVTYFWDYAVWIPWLLPQYSRAPR